MANAISRFFQQLIVCMQSPLTCLCSAWRWLLDLWLVLKPCRFSLISLIVGFVFFGIAPQGVDILRAMTETGKGHLGSFMFFYACIWLWALSIWYWARHMLSFQRVYDAATDCDNKARSKRFIEEVPRVLGALAFLTIWFAFLKAGREYSESIQTGFAVDTDRLAYYYFFSALVFYSFARYRRSLFGKMLGLSDAESLHTHFRKKFSDLPSMAKRFFWLIVVITVSAFIITTFKPVLAAKIGTANLLLIAAANWVLIGTIIVFYGDKFRFPVFTALLILAFIFSAWNDNHDMRYMQDEKGNPLVLDDQRPEIGNHFQQWLTPRLANWKNRDKKFPLYIVAAEGGGIRAAYWTATMLGAIQDNKAEFANHVYTMSGVSGGSLGIASFSSLLKAENNKAEFTDACFMTTKGQKKIYRHELCAKVFLSNDFLAPVAGRMLYGDLVQRFLPFSVKAFDRARAIEFGWQHAWKQLTGTDYFSQAFLDLYEANNAKSNLPVMYFNSTWVEQGQRVFTSNVKQSIKFITANDLHEVTKRQLPLSTAVHNSARFTYVSPAGTVMRSEMIEDELREVAWGHLVDGGYFENSGATIALEVLRTIKKQAGNDWQKIRPIILMITNDPALNDNEDKNASPIANELLSPIRAMLNTRGGRGSYSRLALKKEIEDNGGVFKEFGLQNTKGPVPLGWVLSDAAKDTMKERLDCYIREMNADPFEINDRQNCNSPGK